MWNVGLFKFNIYVCYIKIGWCNLGIIFCDDGSC